MCRRYVMANPAEQFAEVLGIPTPSDLAPRFNLAPTQPIPIVCRPPYAPRSWLLARWGLVPFWSRDPFSGPVLFNARAESALTNRAFHGPLLYRRCVLPATGWYVWRKMRERGETHPFLLRPVDQRPLFFAGLWEEWGSPDGSPLLTATVLTRPVKSAGAELPERTPLWLRTRQGIDAWLDPRADGPALLDRLRTEGWPDQEMQMTPVSNRVNNLHFDDPSCLEADAGTGAQSLLFGEID